MTSPIVFEWPVYKKKSCSETLPSQKTLARFFKTAFTHALIVSPWPSLPGWASQSVIWREVGRARRVTIPSKNDDRARRVTLLIETAFCLSYKRFATFCKETPVLPSKYVNRWSELMLTTQAGINIYNISCLQWKRMQHVLMLYLFSYLFLQITLWQMSLKRGFRSYKWICYEF